MNTKPAKKLPFRIPSKDDAEFSALPGNVRREVRVWGKRFQRIWHVRPITGAIRRLARVCDVGYGTTIRKYYKLRASGGDWRVLIDRAKVPTMPLTVSVPMPPAGIRVAILAHTDSHVLLQIRPAKK